MRPFSSAFVENVFFSCFFLHLASITQSSQYSLEKNVLQDCRHQSSSWPPSMTLLCSSVGDRDRDRLRKHRSSPRLAGSKIGEIRCRSRRLIEIAKMRFRSRSSILSFLLEHLHILVKSVVSPPSGAWSAVVGCCVFKFRCCYIRITEYRRIVYILSLIHI